MIFVVLLVGGILGYVFRNEVSKHGYGRRASSTEQWTVVDEGE